jgi:hypothetical protein
MDDYLVFALTIVLSINAMLFLGQASIENIATEIGSPSATFYDPSGSLICGIDGANCAEEVYVIDGTNPTELYPGHEPIESGDGNFFTDMFASVKRFFSDTLGLGYVMNILQAPKTFLDLTGLPNEVSFALAAMWYLLTFFLILAFFWGR